MDRRCMIGLLGLIIAPLTVAGQTAPAPSGVITVAPTQVPEIDACKASGLIALKELSPGVKDVALDLDSVRVIKTTSKIENIPIKTVVLADVFVQRVNSGKPQNFICIIGEKGKVLLTLFTKD